MDGVIRCYNCGNPLSEDNKTKEHIPAKNLFEGYGGDYKKNRITVPACQECNNAYSHIDEEFRNLIGMIANNNLNDKISEKAMRGIRRTDKFLSRIRLNKDFSVRGVSFSYNDMVEFIKKNFKGIFYHQYNIPLPKSYKIEVVFDEKVSIANMIISYLKNFKWKESGHRDIFLYCMQPIRDITFSGNMEPDIEISENEQCVACIMRFNKELDVLAFAISEHIYSL